MRTLSNLLFRLFVLWVGLGIGIIASAEYLAAQAIITKWQFNKNGAKASYWENTAVGMMAAPQFVLRTSPDSADVLRVCYTNDFVWVRCHGLTQNMGQYLNPGQCLAQNYTFRLPRNPTVPTTKTTASLVGAIGVLLNGVPIYGLSNANSWNGTTNTNMGGRGVWWVEVYKSEGFVLDTAFGAHPQQQGAYHTHATPFRLYRSTPTTQHSPLIGFAFDGYPVYGPYGYSSAMNANSAITRMKSGFSLRNITVRTTLSNGSALSAAQQGPAVSTQYPIGTYTEDYEWLASNGGDLDRYNGRFCVTPDYPNGIYAYFTTIDAAGKPAFPYIIGPQYYGAPDTQNFGNPMSGSTTTIPSTVTNCLLPNTVTSSVRASVQEREDLLAFPQPAHDELILVVPSDIVLGGATVEIVNALGQRVYESEAQAYSLQPAVAAGSTTTLRLETQQAPGWYAVRIINKTTGRIAAKTLRME
jgi:hypothetical protein